jgi:hypothetical protein
MAAWVERMAFDMVEMCPAIFAVVFNRFVLDDIIHYNFKMLQISLEGFLSIRGETAIFFS